MQGTLRRTSSDEYRWTTRHSCHVVRSESGEGVIDPGFPEARGLPPLPVHRYIIGSTWEEAATTNAYSGKSQPLKHEPMRWQYPIAVQQRHRKRAIIFHDAEACLSLSAQHAADARADPKAPEEKVRQATHPDRPRVSVDSSVGRADSRRHHATADAVGPSLCESVTGCRWACLRG